MADKKNAFRNIVIVVVAMVMSACSYTKPNARILNQTPDGAPVIYKQGWKDGCESGMALAGNQYYKASYSNKINVSLVNNQQYFRGWNEAKLYCAHYTMAVLWESGNLVQTPTEDRSLLPEQPKGVFSVASAWGATTPFNWSGTDPEEEESEGVGGIVWR